LFVLAKGEAENNFVSGCEVLTAVIKNVATFRDIEPCSTSME
jgi:hypothetical protein